MKAYVFPGQGAQFEGMGKDLFTNNPKAKKVFIKADDILGYSLSEIMFDGTPEDLKETKVTQPALFVHSMATIATLEGAFQPAAVAGHSLGEFTALAASGALGFEDALLLVYDRAMAMQDACDITEGTMAAILGLDDELVERICSEIDDIVVPANYNCPGQLVISGTKSGIDIAIERLKEAGAKRALPLPVGGAFHSPLMDPARELLAEAIENTTFLTPICPVYQNFDALAYTSPDDIMNNLIDQLTGAVRWTQLIQNMHRTGINTFVECGGNGKVLGGLIKKIVPDPIIETV